MIKIAQVFKNISNLFSSRMSQSMFHSHEMDIKCSFKNLSRLEDSGVISLLVMKSEGELQ